MKYWFILICCFCFSKDIVGIHVLGSDVSYTLSCDEVQGRILVDVTFTLYRDVYQGGNTDFKSLPNVIEVGIYRRDATTGEFVLDDPIRNVFDIDVTDIRREPIVLQGNLCFDESLNVRFQTDKFEYFLERFALDVIDTEYRISAQRCCRSGAIVNILNPATTGILSEVIITPEAQMETICNNSPVFDFDPEIVICNGFPQLVQSGATDPDGDELRYSFTTPEVAGGSLGDVSNPCPTATTDCRFECDGTEPDASLCLPDLFTLVQYETGFSFDNPIMASVPFTINEQTGEISGTAAAVGTYLIGVKVVEFRNGIKIGEVKRDFNLSVANCNQEAVIGPPGQQSRIQDFLMECDGPVARISQEFDPCGAATVQLENYVNANPQSVTFRWTVFDESGTNELDRNEVDWNPSFDLPLGMYVVRFTLFPDIICEDFCEMMVNVTVPLDADFTLDLDNGAFCEDRPIEIDLPIEDPDASYMWDFGDGQTSNQYDPGPINYTSPNQYEVQLAIQRGVCTENASSGTFNYFPLPTNVSVLPDRFQICGDQTVDFQHITLQDPGMFSYTWDFGDGETADGFNTQHNYQSTGSFNVSLEISTADCSSTTTFPWELEVLPSPRASFDPSLTVVRNPAQSIEFTNTSIDATSFQWDFGDGSPPSFQDSPVHQYDRPDDFEVVLTAFSPINSCMDVASMIISVSAAGRPIFPNAFRPNGINTEFKPVSVFDNFEAYTLRVFDRWGGIVFETTDFSEGWNGRKNNSGSILPQDVYSYQYTFEVIDGNERVIDGSAGTVLLLN